MKRLREKTGLTQKEFARKYHVSLRTLQGWEAGRTVPDSIYWMLDRIITLEEMLGEGKKG